METLCKVDEAARKLKKLQRQLGGLPAGKAYAAGLSTERPRVKGMVSPAAFGTASRRGTGAQAGTSSRQRRGTPASPSAFPVTPAVRKDKKAAKRKRTPEERSGGSGWSLPVRYGEEVVRHKADKRVCGPVPR